jgi:hypothetical protein
MELFLSVSTTARQHYILVIPSRIAHSALMPLICDLALTHRGTIDCLPMTSWLRVIRFQHALISVAVHTSARHRMIMSGF